jgi:hypothetical protein
MRRIPSPIVRTRPARPRISLSRPMARLDIPCIGRGIEASLFVPTTSSYSENRFSVLLRSSQLVLTVVGNEKGGGSGGWLLFKDAFGPWRSMSVYFLMLPPSFIQSISISCLKKRRRQH